MAKIDTDRLLELMEIYSNMKKRILLVDEKYSLDYIEPELDMPDSLNLTKLEYTPKTEQELKDLAEQYVQASIISKQASLSSNFNAKLNSLTNQTTKLEYEETNRLEKLIANFNNDKDELNKRIINNGLVFSTVKTKYENKINKQFQADTEKFLREYREKKGLIIKQRQDAAAIYQQDYEALYSEKEAKIAVRLTKLREEEEALKRSIEKYNTSLDEKEAKYQATRARAYESARRAAHNRAIENSKLYMQMGEVGFRRAIQQEKYAIAQDAFFPLTREEGNVLLSHDSFLVYHLGTYYDAFVDWVNMTLLP